MKRAIIYVVAAVVVIGALAAAVPALRQRARQIAADLKIISSDTVDVMSSAVYRRFARRREAVASMRAALLQVAAIESTFVADSGRPTVSLFGRYVPKDQYIFGPSVEIQRDRWVAKVSHRNTTMSCTLTAMVDPMTFDSITWRYHVGAPVCAGWSAESTALANASVPVNPVPESQAPAEPARGPRQHHDWGPVNNTPPPTPWIVQNECEGEGCTTHGQWAACSTLVAVREKRLDSPAVFRARPGETFTALTSDVHVEIPGMVVFRDTISNPGSDAVEIDSIRFTPADTLYTLNYEGEGYLTWWFRGHAASGYQFWEEFSSPKWAPKPSDPVALVRRQKAVTWVRVRNAAGTEGWIVLDYDKMATGGYMDEIGRCLHTAKG